MRRVKWDAGKANANWKKHRVHFEEAETVFYDPLVESIGDPDHSDEENRYRAIGTSRTDRLLVIAYTIRDDDVWLISARVATPAERRRSMRGDRIYDKSVVEAEDIPETDFTNAIRGLHWIPRALVRVSVDEDVARYFPDDESVNAALRMLIAEGRAPEPRNE